MGHNTACVGRQEGELAGRAGRHNCIAKPHNKVTHPPIGRQEEGNKAVLGGTPTEHTVRLSNQVPQCGKIT